MQNKFVSGYLAGVIAGVVMAALNLISFTLGIAKVRYLDIAAMVVWGDFPESTREEIFAQVFQIAIAGLIGIAFAYLLPKLENSYLLLKGSTYGAAVWVTIHTLGTLFHISILEKSTPETNLSHLVTATIFGLVLTVVLAWLESYKHYNPPNPP
ncbi:DUF6789 family protein [Sporomusa sp.]|uniref:DUF6789 family protein n=1 Tax=Sporomusa sp. TaxID=2078658 RepID=UPI002CAC90EB|nr:DUF6789 family protein [Sporomusa sp.]HWR42813.1 DUF6789 family protein [Sporomusa sp.]